MRRVSMMCLALALALGGCTDTKKKVEPNKKAALQKKNEGAPQIACDKPEHDYGKVDQGKEVKHVFVIKNKGSAPLTINRAAGG